MRYTWLASVLRGAGLTVNEVDGWKTRGADTFGPVRGITCHHTAGSRNSSDAGEIRTLLNGSTSAPPPIAQLYLSRTGEWWVVAAGACNHNRVGWGGPNSGYGNDALLGIEAQHSGAGEPWTPLQYNSYVRGVAALVRHDAAGWNVSVDRVAGHKEHQPGAKSDPTFNMDTFRATVRREINEWGDDVMNAEQERKLDRLLAAVDQLPAETWNHLETDPLSTAKPAGKGRVGGWLRMAEARAQARHRDLVARLTALGADVNQVDEQVLAALGGPDVPIEQQAAAIRAMVGEERAAQLAPLLSGS